MGTPDWRRGLVAIVTAILILQHAGRSVEGSGMDVHGPVQGECGRWNLHADRRPQ